MGIYFTFGIYLCIRFRSHNEATLNSERQSKAEKGQIRQLESQKVGVSLRIALVLQEQKTKLSKV